MSVHPILKERLEQVFKHNRTPVQDALFNKAHQLPQAASVLLEPDSYIQKLLASEKADCPEGWNKAIWLRMLQKPYKERLIIGGALILAEHTRLEFADFMTHIPIADRPIIRQRFNKLLEDNKEEILRTFFDKEGIRFDFVFENKHPNHVIRVEVHTAQFTRGWQIEYTKQTVSYK